MKPATCSLPAYPGVRLFRHGSSCCFCCFWLRAAVSTLLTARAVPCLLVSCFCLFCTPARTVCFKFVIAVVFLGVLEKARLGRWGTGDTPWQRRVVSRSRGDMTVDMWMLSWQIWASTKQSG